MNYDRPPNLNPNLNLNLNLFAKSEFRIPKSERNPKSEIRNTAVLTEGKRLTNPAIQLNAKAQRRKGAASSIFEGSNFMNQAPAKSPEPAKKSALFASLRLGVFALICSRRIVPSIRISAFGFVSDFGFRISDFAITQPPIVP